MYFNYIINDYYFENRPAMYFILVSVYDYILNKFNATI